MAVSVKRHYVLHLLKSHITADIDDSDAKIEIIYFAEYGFCPKFANKKDDDTGR